MKFCTARIRNFHSFFFRPIIMFHQWPFSDRISDNLSVKKFIMSTERNANGLYSVSRAAIRYKIANDFHTRRLHNSRSNRVFLLRVRRSRLLSKLNRIPEFWRAASINTGVNQTYRDFLSCFLWKSLKTRDIMIETASVNNRHSRPQAYQNFFIEFCI